MLLESKQITDCNELISEQNILRVINITGNTAHFLHAFFMKFFIDIDFNSPYDTNWTLMRYVKNKKAFAEYMKMEYIAND